MTVYILRGKRTPLGSFLGQNSQIKSTKMGSTALKGALSELQGISAEQIEQVHMGQVLQTGVGQAPARQVALEAGLSESTICTTVNKVCGSGMQTILHGSDQIQLGHARLIAAGGMENMSLSPHFVPGMRFGAKFGNVSLIDSMGHDGLTDVRSGQAMGVCADACAKEYKISRNEQDEFAAESFRRSQKATEEGLFKDEISPLTVTYKGRDTILEKDEGPYKVKFEKIPQLKAAFTPDGTVTAANASTLNDGAAVVILGGEEFKQQAKFKVLSYAYHAQDPFWFTTAPIGAMKKCAEKANIQMSDVDLFEVNEAFGVVSLVAMKELNLKHEKVNIFGGAISLGHPLGCSGTRIVVTLMNAMEKKKSKLGMASLCIGGGEALALLIEQI